MFLNMLENAMTGFSISLIILDIWQDFEYASGIKYAKVLNMLQYSYNNIIFVTNIVILKELRNYNHKLYLCPPQK